MPSKVMQQKGQVTIQHDYDFQMDCVIEHRRPNVIILNKRDTYCQSIHVAKPNDTNVE